MHRHLDLPDCVIFKLASHLESRCYPKIIPEKACCRPSNDKIRSRWTIGKHSDFNKGVKQLTRTMGPPRFLKLIMRLHHDTLENQKNIIFTWLDLGEPKCLWWVQFYKNGVCSPEMIIVQDILYFMSACTALYKMKAGSTVCNIIQYKRNEGGLLIRAYNRKIMFGLGSQIPHLWLCREKKNIYEYMSKLGSTGS